LNSPDVSIAKAGSGVLVTMHRPDPSNSLNEIFLSQISDAISETLLDSKIQTICLAGQPDVFMLGADLRFFVRCLLAHDLDRILRFTRSAHELLARIEKDNKPVTAWVRGPAYGAGLELALACKQIVAAPNAKFALPETGLGIYPGMGGTQRTPRRIGIGLAKWMIFTGAVLPAEQALEIGLIDAIHPNATTAWEAMGALKSPKSVAPRSTRFEVLEELFARNEVATLCDPSFVAPNDPHAVRALVQMRSKAPLALRLAEIIIDRGARLPHAAAIEEEFAHLSEIFATEDAKAGLLSFGRKTPQYMGR
jgi:enoyl-CoA hydratase/carnithine racemase